MSDVTRKGYYLEKVKKCVAFIVQKGTDGEMHTFFFHPDRSKFDFMYLHPSLLMTKDAVQDKVNECDSVFYLGSFADYYGKNKNYPILRFGRISLLPEEYIEV